jgi:hypothetical protein
VLSSHGIHFICACLQLIVIRASTHLVSESEPVATMKLTSSPLVAVFLLSVVTLSSAANVERNLTVSESTIRGASPRYLGTTAATEADDSEEWAELVQAATTFEAEQTSQDVRILNQQTYHAADGCLANNAKQTDICLASEHSSNVAVHCCRGSIENDNLKCSRDGCKTRSTFAAAKNYCENKGMRLCSVAELETGACCDKGCGWNKKISWTSDSCETDNPPTNPKSSSSGTLVTFEGDRSADYESTVGVMFEVEAREDVSITSLSTLTGSSTKIWTEVWTREGSYTGKTASNDGWEMIYFKKSQQRGTAAPTEINFETPVVIREGSSASFYIVSPGMIASVESDVKEGKSIAQNDSIKLYSGLAIAHDRWERGCSNGKECIFSARSFQGTISYEAVTITSPPTPLPTMDPFRKTDTGRTERENQWLHEHNIRREEWHEKYGKKYKPLKWSEDLKDMAQKYADDLASDCGATVHDSYANREGYGENLASNTGFGDWAELKPVEKIMTRFVENEQDWVPPANNHFMQVLWYSTTHVGCADAMGKKPNGAICRYQVCRYARPGNCGVKSFNDGSKRWWMKAVMQDSSRCKPLCPPEGC